MTIDRLKNPVRQEEFDDSKTTEIVKNILRDIELEGEIKLKEYSEKLDGYSGPFLVTCEQIEEAKSQVSEQMKSDIAFAHRNVEAFAKAQRQSMHEFELEVDQGLFAGQRLIPIETAGCYIPGGRYSHIASAIMSITTAKVAGVSQIIACSPPDKQGNINPAILYTMDLCGADTILALGGVQAIAAMAYGVGIPSPANFLAGPGNRFVAEAKRLLFGKVGIDVFAGPSEIAIIADETADPDLVITDLIGQAEHGLDSPVWLITTDPSLAKYVIDHIEEKISRLPDLQRQAAQASWKNFGEVVLCSSREEAAQVSDEYAAEHLEVHAKDEDYWLKRLKNYGSLFLGEETTVAFADKCSGTNHILPTKGAAKYTGGLSVGKFLKTVTYQRMDKQSMENVASITARISRLEGMEAHARTGDHRLNKYFPGKTFSTGSLH
ncbi:MAG: histidinol dehydrogenase [Oligoflexales bacterium]